MSDLFAKIIAWFESTHVQEQVKDVDVVGLFTNPWFLVPFILVVAYLFYKQGWKDLIIISLFIAVWWVSGTEYMDTLIVNGELQISKILPVLFGGAALLGFVIYMFFGRSD
ncbi:MAG: hypothetical protein KKD01_09190 [Proteobacteria bacterium]|nr:hypothetical protein [Pseudomonadota bacterium]MBU1234847.1 hypothetical protein [Pseudomonadota bacterium]MBU1418513.1 hypothetical protein [Pseudomonadota bacterium]MBU1454884.1 hypothetical protein [Pseudomonadota bacterium]